MRLFVVACLATLCDARCELWTSSICEYLRGFEVSDPSTRSSVCKGLCPRHRNCDAMCECIAQNYEATCECDIGDCGQQRQSMICDLGCPYLEDSCKALCSCLVETKACSPMTTLHEPPPLELVTADTAVPLPIMEATSIQPAR